MMRKQADVLVLKWTLTKKKNVANRIESISKNEFYS